MTTWAITAPFEVPGAGMARFRDSANSCLSIARFHFLGRVIRAPWGIVSATSQPLALIFLMTVIGGTSILPYVLAGAIVYFAVGEGVADLPIEVSAMQNRSKFKAIYVGSPLTPGLFMIGTALGIGLASSPQLVGITLIFALLFRVSASGLLLIAFCVLLLWLWSATLGFYFATRFKEPILLIRFVNVFLLLSTIIAPVYYPIALVPAAAQPFILAIPTSSAAMLISSTAVGVTANLPSLLLGIGLIILVTTLTVIVALARTQWRDD